MAKTNTKVSETATATVEKKKGWRIKAYWVDPAAYKAATDELAKAPNQVRIMMAHFAKIADKEDLAAQGKVLCQAAIDDGGLKTVIDPAVLFAYYRKTMEGFGLRLRG
jgi:hypothetical protein